jgi:hypothetical protein
MLSETVKKTNKMWKASTVMEAVDKICDKFIIVGVKAITGSAKHMRAALKREVLH